MAICQDDSFEIEIIHQIMIHQRNLPVLSAARCRILCPSTCLPIGGASEFNTDGGKKTIFSMSFLLFTIFFRYSCNPAVTTN